MSGKDTYIGDNVAEALGNTHHILVARPTPNDGICVYFSHFILV